MPRTCYRFVESILINSWHIFTICWPYLKYRETYTTPRSKRREEKKKRRRKGSSRAVAACGRQLKNIVKSKLKIPHVVLPQNVPDMYSSLHLALQKLMANKLLLLSVVLKVTETFSSSVELTFLPKMEMCFAHTTQLITNRFGSRSISLLDDLKDIWSDDYLLLQKHVTLHYMVSEKNHPLTSEWNKKALFQESMVQCKSIVTRPNCHPIAHFWPHNYQ